MKDPEQAFIFRSMLALLVFILPLSGCEDNDSEDDNEPALSKGSYSLTIEGALNEKIPKAEEARFRTHIPADTKRLGDEYNPEMDDVLWIQLTGEGDDLLDSVVFGIFKEDGVIKKGNYEVEPLHDAGAGFTSRTLGYFRFKGQNGPPAKGIGGSVVLQKITKDMVEGRLNDISFKPADDSTLIKIEGQFRALNYPPLQPRSISKEAL